MKREREGGREKRKREGEMNFTEGRKEREGKKGERGKKRREK